MSIELTEQTVPCRGCVYFAETTKTCDYILMTEHCRPCPPGRACTVKSEPLRKKKTARGRLDRDATLRALYKEGKNDREISDLLGYSTGAILNWRQRHGYQANYKGGRPPKPPKGQKRGGTT